MVLFRMMIAAFAVFCWIIRFEAVGSTKLHGERKASIIAVQKLLNLRDEHPPLLLSPSDYRTTALNDFPCAETELHTCSCQVCA